MCLLNTRISANIITHNEAIIIIKTRNNSVPEIVSVVEIMTPPTTSTAIPDPIM
ncbi:hypothetical protein D3C85_1770750 [compost metagenome]